MTMMVPRNKMLAAVSKKIRCLSDKNLNHNLSYFCGSMADAYRFGVEEAQGEILSRLQSLPTHIGVTAKSETAK
jgi:hypothetical protein